MTEEETAIFNIRDKSDLPKNFTGVVVFTDGSIEWLLNGKSHRVDGPAREYVDGYKEWCLNGQGFYSNWVPLSLKGNYIVVARGIPTDKMFGKLKLTQAKLLTAQGTVYQVDNLPGLIIGEGND
jgi:hypothetical protein